MQKLGKEINRKDVQKIIAKHDRTGDGKLNFDEYMAIFFDEKELEIRR